MVIVLQGQGKRSKWGSIGAGLGKGLGEGFEIGKEKRESESIRNKENIAAAKLGIDLSGIHDPKIRQETVKQALKMKMQNQILEQLGLTRGMGIPGEKDQSGLRSERPQGDATRFEEPGLEEGTKTVKLPKLPYSEQQITGATAINPALGSMMQRQNEQAIAESRHQEEMYRKQREFEQRLKEKSPEYQREQSLTQEQAKADSKYFNELQSASKQHAVKMKTLDNLERINKKGVTGKPYEKLLEKSGLVALTSSGRREFAADVKNLITDIRSILGSQFTGFEFQTILNAYPSADFSQDANNAIIKNLKEFEGIRDQEFKISNQLKKENGGKIPEGFQEKVNERLQEYAQSRLPDIKSNTYQIMKEEYGIPQENILMFSPDREPLNVPQDQVEYYESLGATIFQ